MSEFDSLFFIGRKLTVILLEVVLYEPDVMGDFIYHST